jgi:hypothetical protein
MSITAPRHSRLDAALSHSTRYNADWRGHYAEAYLCQNKTFLRFVETGTFPALASDAWDGLVSALLAEASGHELAPRPAGSRWTQSSPRPSTGAAEGAQIAWSLKSEGATGITPFSSATDFSSPSRELSRMSSCSMESQPS